MMSLKLVEGWDEGSRLEEIILKKKFQSAFSINNILAEDKNERSSQAYTSGK